jgi:hypothetical protein
MRVLLLLIFYLLATSIETKTVKKEVRLANFYKDGPFIFMTKLHIGAGYGQIDIIYTYKEFKLEKEMKSLHNHSTAMSQSESSIQPSTASFQQQLHVQIRNDFYIRRRD